MGRRLWREILGFVFWTHERGSFRYDILLALILAFIFLTPRSFFQDRQIPETAPIVVLEEQGAYLVDAARLGGSGGAVEARTLPLLEAFTGKPMRIRRVEPVLEPGGRPMAYKIWAEAR